LKEPTWFYSNVANIWQSAGQSQAVITLNKLGFDCRSLQHKTQSCTRTLRGEAQQTVNTIGFANGGVKSELVLVEPS
jgi:hypothetical protein